MATPHRTFTVFCFRSWSEGDKGTRPSVGLLCSFVALVFLMPTLVHLGHYGQMELRVTGLHLHSQGLQANVTFARKKRI